MSNEIWTVKKILDWTTDYFKNAEIENPHLEAEIILAHALKVKRIDLYIKFEKELNKEELSVFKEFILRRKKREPTAYITGIKSFMSLDFIVTKDVLIPRPDTELLIETAMDIAKNLENPSILDIGTGSGAIAVSLAKYIEKTQICATDFSEKALDVAVRNAKKHGVAEKIVFEVADIFPKDTSLKFEIIVSNPPYIKSKDIASLQPEVKNFEPICALDGGEDGLRYYKPIIGGSKHLLKEKGCLILEIDPKVLDETAKLLKESGFNKIDVKKDLNVLDRVIIAS